MKSSRHKSMGPIVGIAKFRWWCHLFKFRAKRFVYDVQDLHPIRRVRRYGLRLYIQVMRLPPLYLIGLVVVGCINLMVLAFLVSFEAFQFLESLIG